MTFDSQLSHDDFRVNSNYTLLFFRKERSPYSNPDCLWLSNLAITLFVRNAGYADWLLKVFEIWYYQKPQTIRIRKFEDIISMMLGLQGSSEELGLQAVDFAVIETNGDIEAVDTLKVTYPTATKLGMNIFTHSFDDIFESQKVIERQKKWQHLSQTCQECSLVEVCGGGYIPHRYSSKNQFQNPSVYCSDLKKIITTIQKTVIQDLQLIKQKKLTYIQ